MRADARRNQERLLDAAVDVILEVGGQPPLDAIAKRARVGIGTLYRHYPDRESLLQAVALHVLDRAIAAAESALADAPTGYDALCSYMHAALESGVGVLNLLHPLLAGPDWSRQRDRMAPLLRAIVDRCKQQGSVRNDLCPEDIVIPIIRFSRPLGAGVPRVDERALARRHLDIYLSGLLRPAP
jgi:AcrR family transcriptional regulator